jgi:hypothetical protein
MIQGAAPFVTTVKQQRCRSSTLSLMVVREKASSVRPYPLLTTKGVQTADPEVCDVAKW